MPAGRRYPVETLVTYDTAWAEVNTSEFASPHNGLRWTCADADERPDQSDARIDRWFVFVGNGRFG